MELPNRLMVAVAFIQGLLLLLLYRAVDADLWPAHDPVWLVSIATFLISVPTFFLFSIKKDNFRRLSHCLCPYTILILAIAAYTGLQLEPEEIVSEDAIAAIFTLTLIIATFKALMYSQEYADGNVITYSSLLNNSWQNFLVMGVSIIFSLLFLGVLFLWGSLFELIGIGVFNYLFTRDWFLIPASTVAFGVAIITFRRLTNIVDSLARLLKTLFKFLLPILATIVLLFLCFLPFTGLQSLWDTNYGSGLLLWLQALMLFTTNSVYQNGRDSLPYPLDMHRFIYVAIATLPVYSLLIFYGMSIRIAQYGLTVSRCWGLIVAFIIFLFCIGYLVSIIKKRDDWLTGMAWVNIKMGLIVLAFMVLVNTPVLNLQGLSAQNQLNRHLSGQVSFSELDLTYLRWSLGRQGYLVLEELKSMYADSDPGLVADIDFVIENNRFTQPRQPVAEMQSMLVIWPESRELPEVVRDSIRTSGANSTTIYALFLDQNNDGNEEILTLVESNNSGRLTNIMLWSFEQNGWRAYAAGSSVALLKAVLDEALVQNALLQEPNPWNNLRIDQTIITVNPSGTLFLQVPGNE